MNNNFLVDIFKEIKTLLISNKLLPPNILIELIIKKKVLKSDEVHYDIHSESFIIKCYERLNKIPFPLCHEFGHIVYAFKYSNGKFIKNRYTSKRNKYSVYLWRNWKKEIFSDLFALKILLKLGYTKNQALKGYINLIDLLNDNIEDRNKYHKSHPCDNSRIIIMKDYLNKKSCQYLNIVNRKELCDYSRYCNFRFYIKKKKEK